MLRRVHAADYPPPSLRRYCRMGERGPYGPTLSLLSGDADARLSVGADGLAMSFAPAAGQVRVERIMGTVVSLDVRAAHPDADVVAAGGAAMAWLRDVDARFSTYRADSEISRINRRDLDLHAASPDVRAILARCADLRAETDGWFEAGAPGALDPSALVKGWAVQRAADGLSAAGITDFCLTAGGDLVVRGGARPAACWRVGIQHPRDRQAIAATLHATSLAVATSGAYERGAHVRDPRSGRPPGGVLSVTVTGPDLGTADAYSTAAFAMGLGGPAWTLRLRGYEAMTILADDTVLATPGFPGQDPAT
jgi:thiamine biosynthesis lipoprotein